MQNELLKVHNYLQLLELRLYKKKIHQSVQKLALIHIMHILIEVGLFSNMRNYTTFSKR